MSVYAPEIGGYADLAKRFAARAYEYASAEPFPHAVFRGLFDADLLRTCAREFPDTADMTIQFDREREVKSAEDRWESFGPATRSVVAEAQSAPFIKLLEALTGERELMSDPQLWGGGQHQIRPGGLLGVHADFNQHPYYSMTRRLNVLLYLNDGWDREWGGELELWDSRMTDAVQVIEPAINTLVIFTTTSESFHGHPDPVRCPPDQSRKSLAFYYYAIGASQDDRHWTLFQARPGETQHEPSRLTTSIRHLKMAAYPWIPKSLRDRGTRKS